MPLIAVTILVVSYQSILCFLYLGSRHSSVRMPFSTVQSFTKFNLFNDNVNFCYASINVNAGLNKRFS